MTKETLDRANELEKEISGLRNKIEALEDVIRHEQELSEKGEDAGEIRYTSNRRIETPKCIYPNGAVIVFKTINVLDLLTIEKVRLNQRLIELEKEFEEL